MKDKPPDGVMIDDTVHRGLKGFNYPRVFKYSVGTMLSQMLCLLSISVKKVSFFTMKFKPCSDILENFVSLDELDKTSGA